MRINKKLKKLNTNIPLEADTKAPSVADFVTKQADASDLQAEGMEIRRFKINRARDDTLSFKRNAGDARRGNPTRPVLSRALAVERCALVREAIIEDSTVDTIIYEDGIDGNTVARFIACFSVQPAYSRCCRDLRRRSPGSAGHKDRMVYERTGRSLQVRTHATGDCDMCDMVIDRVHEELHHPQYCLRRSITGMKAAFKLLDISPAFLNLLSKYEKKGFEFFAEVWVTTIEDTLELLKTSGIGSWRHQVKHTLIEKLESDGASEASKNNTAAICPQYHHRQGSEVICCKSKVPETLTVVASAMQELPILPPTPKKQVEPSKCQQSSKNFKRRRLRTDKVAFEKIERRAREASEGVHSESNDERPKSRFQKSQQELHDNWNEYKGICDTEILSEDEDCNAIVVRLPEVYSKARDFFRSSTGSYGEPYKHAHVLSGAKQRKQNTRSSDGLKYRDKGMNLVKDTAEVQRKKVAIVEERLQTFHDYGYVSDSGKLRGGPKTMSRLASRDVEMMDKDEGDHRI